MLGCLQGLNLPPAIQRSLGVRLRPDSWPNLGMSPPHNQEGRRTLTGLAAVDCCADSEFVTVPLLAHLGASALPTTRQIQEATPIPYRGPIVHYADAAQFDPDVCWRFVRRSEGYCKGPPTACPAPVRWMGRTVIGRSATASSPVTATYLEEVRVVLGCLEARRQRYTVAKWPPTSRAMNSMTASSRLD
jgi:hypothetical protein